MHLTEIAQALAAIGVAPKVLALGTRAEYSWCIEMSSDDVWEVYWYERGTKNDLAQLRSESDACFYLLGRLAYCQLLTGAIQPR